MFQQTNSIGLFTRGFQGFRGSKKNSPQCKHFSSLCFCHVPFLPVGQPSHVVKFWDTVEDFPKFGCMEGWTELAPLLQWSPQPWRVSRAEWKHRQADGFPRGLGRCVADSITLVLMLAKHNKVRLTTFHPFTRNWKGRITKLRYWCSSSGKNKNSFLPIQIE